MRLTLLAVLAVMAFLGIATAAHADTYGDRLASEVARADSWFNFSSYTPTRFEEWSTAGRNVYVTRKGWQDTGNPVAPIIQSRWRAVPLPCAFGASPGTDQEAVLQWHGSKPEGTFDYYEFWGMHWEWGGCGDNGWAARWGGGANNSEFIQGPGGLRAWPQGMGVQGSGIAFFPGVITVADLQRGVINHAVQFAVPEACSNFVAPAQRTDGSGTMASNPRCFPYGVLMKAPADAACPAGATAFCRMLLQAAKDYGLMATDQTHNTLTIRFENYKRKSAPWGTTNPYVPFMSGADCDKSQWRGCGNRLNQMWGFPWSSLFRA